MKRREFIMLVGGAAAAWPLAARAQQAAMPVIGFLHVATPQSYAPSIAALRRGLGEMGFVEGRNLAIEFRWAQDQYERLPELAADLVRRQVAVIIAVSGAPAAIAAKAATATIPIVFATGGDPVRLGLVASFNRPGGNATGFVQFSEALITKRLELLREFVPTAGVVGVLASASGRAVERELASIEAAARNIGQQLRIFKVTDQYESVFAAIAQERVAALLVQNSARFTNNREQLVAMAARYSMPASYEHREFAEAGGLFSYGSDLVEQYRQTGIYAGRILKGEKPAEMPVVQPTKFQFVISLKTAKALGLEVPPGLSARADEVIE
jgi:putative tryptophan/tyrosine transport system substrate-binding protein